MRAATSDGRGPGVDLAVTLYPLHRALARRVGGRQGLAAVLRF